jgi:hypothetical protein
MFVIPGHLPQRGLKEMSNRYTDASYLIPISMHTCVADGTHQASLKSPFTLKFPRLVSWLRSQCHVSVARRSCFTSTSVASGV